jgi:hypothetical protein
VAKKHRVRARSRRAVEASRRASAVRPAATEREASRPVPSARAIRYGSRSGTSRAVGAPSASLERAAAWERGYVTKDFRRMAIVVAIALVLLIAAGLILNALGR